MNFNYIAKSKIDKGRFDSCFKARTHDSNHMSVYFYKIATIIANKYGLRNHEIRQDFIQDSVYVAYKRHGNYNHDSNKSAYSYFYKVILNNFRDIMRKDCRRKNKVQMVSYERTEDNVIPYHVFTDDYLAKFDNPELKQKEFIECKDIINSDSINTSADINEFVKYKYQNLLVSIFEL